jgi:hypothetical protein
MCHPRLRLLSQASPSLVSRSAARAAGIRGEPLEWIIPQLSRVRDRVEVLADSSRLGQHSAAARDVLTTLHIGARGLLDFEPAMPSLPGQSIHGDSVSFLYELGHHLDRTIRDQGLTWPPPRAQPPPSVVLDLVAMYRYGSRQVVPAGGDPWLLLWAKLETVVRLSGALLDQWSPSDVASIQRIVAHKPGRRSRVGAFLSGTALVVSLIQGPGAIRDLPRDTASLGADARSAASTIVRALSSIVHDVSKELQ